MDDLRGKTALVTGAASGIGRATALALAAAGADLVLCDVDAAGLEETAARVRTAGRRAEASVVDVANRDAMRAFAASVHRARPAVDVLVNNAGVALGGDFLDTTLEDWDWIVSINLMGVVHGCHFFLPPMVARGAGGHVVNVSSAAGYVATAPLAAYATTKFGVFGLSEALRDELRPHGIGVTTICPGFVNTPITRRARLRGRAAAPEAQQAMIRFYERRNYGPERVGAAIVRSIRRNRTVVPVAPEAWVLWALKRLAPNLTARLNHAVSARMERRALGARPASR
ncbi:MAG TPA: SDR family NAD(P)-dependent oxidoreductase [Candidatus Binatia bacterium]|nr:SDR family NAD(P)-dependent oxidoreductase [Candidatus Binatia bacterium]